MREKKIEMTVPGQESEMSYICVLREGEGGCLSLQLF